jgi:hypothetical protein
MKRHPRHLALAAPFVVVVGCGGDGASPSAPDAEAKEDSGTAGYPQNPPRPLLDGATGEADAPPSCSPLAVLSGFAPKWVPPRAHENACSAQEIEDFRKYCLGAGDANGCNALLQTAHAKACVACILTPPSAAAYGPLIDYSEANGFVSLDTAGCVALAQGDVSDSSCGAKILALAECDVAACASCHVVDDATMTTLGQCEANGESGACQAYVEPARCGAALAEAGSAPAKACFAGSDFSDFDAGYDALVPLFCLDETDAGDGG